MTSELANEYSQEMTTLITEILNNQELMTQYLKITVVSIIVALLLVIATHMVTK